MSTKFKKTVFDYTQIIILNNGRYILSGGIFGKEKRLNKLTEYVLKSENAEAILSLAISNRAFRYLARTIQPKVDSLPLLNSCIVLYSPATSSDVPHIMVK